MGARNRVEKGLSDRPAMLHKLVESILRINSWAPLKFKNTISVMDFRTIYWGSELSWNRGVVLAFQSLNL
jgi:hypothetical protein